MLALSGFDSNNLETLRCHISTVRGAFGEWRDCLSAILQQPMGFKLVDVIESGWHVVYSTSCKIGCRAQLDIWYRGNDSTDLEVSVNAEEASHSIKVGKLFLSPELRTYFQQGPLLRTKLIVPDFCQPVTNWEVRASLGNASAASSSAEPRDAANGWKGYAIGRLEFQHASAHQVLVPAQGFERLSQHRPSASIRAAGKSRGRGGRIRGRDGQSAASNAPHQAVKIEPACSLCCQVLLTTVGLTGPCDILPTHRWAVIGGRDDMLGVRKGLLDMDLTSCYLPSKDRIYKPLDDLHRAAIGALPDFAGEWQSVDAAAALEDCKSCLCLLSTKNCTRRNRSAWMKQLIAPVDVEARRDENTNVGQVRWLVRPCVLLHRLSLSNNFRAADTASCEFAWRIGRNKSSPMKAAKFTLLNNAEDVEHCQPPSFKEHLLRPEQLRSLHWMVDQEASTEPFVCDLVEYDDNETPGWSVEGRARCSFNVRGGILADQIGYGKTAVTIGLIGTTLGKEMFTEVTDAFGLLPSRATLVLVPTNLHAQWIDEIRKFTGKQMRVVSVPTYAQLKGLKVEDLQEADVVVVTYRLFYSPRYLDCLASAVQETRPFRFPPPEHQSFADSYETAVHALRAKVSAAGPNSGMPSSSALGCRGASPVAVQSGVQTPQATTSNPRRKKCGAAQHALAGPLTPEQPRRRCATASKARAGTPRSAPAHARTEASQPAVVSKHGRHATTGSGSEAELSTPSAKKPRVEPASSGEGWYAMSSMSCFGITHQHGRR